MQKPSRQTRQTPAVSDARKVARILAKVKWNQNPGFLITDVQRLIVRAVDNGIRHLDLTNAQLRTILHLCREDGISQVELADEMGVKKASMGVLLERLEEKQLIDRRPHPIDRRVNLIFLSENASGLLQPILTTGTEILDDLMLGVSEEESELLIDLLMKIKGNAEHMLGED